MYSMLSYMVIIVLMLTDFERGGAAQLTPIPCIMNMKNDCILIPTWDIFHFLTY